MSLLAIILGFIVPGTGQVLNRKYIEGLIIFGSWLLWFFVSKYLLELEFVLILAGWLVFVGYSAFDCLLFDPKKIKEENTQLKEFEEMEEEKEKTEESKLAKTKELLEKELEKEYIDFQILEIKRDKNGIKAKSIIEGKYTELTVSENGKIISRK